LELVRREFKQLRGVSVDDLLYIKEDLIIPQTYSFYDLIVTKGFLHGTNHQQSFIFSPYLHLFPSSYLLYFLHFIFFSIHHYSARGKSGPLFHFDVHEDIRMVNDARVEKDEV
jgi:protein FAM50